MVAATRSANLKAARLFPGDHPPICIVYAFLCWAFSLVNACRHSAHGKGLSPYIPLLVIFV